MSKLAALKKKVAETKQKKSKHDRPKLFLDAKQSAMVPTFGREVTLQALGRYFRILDRRRKELEAELEGVKKVIRNHCGKHLDDAGEYYDCAVLGDVRAVRQNRYGVVKGVERDELVDALGEVEYRTMFSESAGIRFKDAAHMRQFLKRCEHAGVVVDADVVVEVKPRAEVKRRLYELGDSVSREVREFVCDVAKDCALAIGVNK